MLAGAADKPGANETYMIGALLRQGVSDTQAAAALMPVFRTLLSSRNETASATIREAVVETRPTLLRESGDLRPLAISLLFLFGLVTAIAAANLTSIASGSRHGTPS